MGTMRSRTTGASVSGAGNQRLNTSRMVAVAAIGDSIVRNQYTPANAGGLVGTRRTVTAFGAWAQWACFFSGQAYLDLYAMEGYSGYRADEILAAAQSATATELWGAASTIGIGIRQRTPQIVFDMSGTNDAYQATSTTIGDGTALAKAIAGRRAIWSYLRACGSLPIALSLLPMQGTTAGSGGLTGAQLAPYIPAWNVAMQAAAVADGVPWVDGYTPCAAASGGGWKPGYTYHNAADDVTGLHPSLLASIEIGRAAALVLNQAIASAPSLPRIYPGNSPIYSATFASGDPRTFFANFSNPLFSSTTGWASRYDPQSDSSFGLYTPSQDVNGGTLRMRKPSNAGSRYADWSGPSLSVNAGEEYLFFCDYRVSSFDGWAAIALGVCDNTSGSASRYQHLAVMNISAKDVPVGTSIDTGVCRVVLYYKVPASVTTVAPLVVVSRESGGVAGGVDDVYISNMLQVRLA